MNLTRLTHAIGWTLWYGVALLVAFYVTAAAIDMSAWNRHKGANPQTQGR
jgi:hypothetical protein